MNKILKRLYPQSHTEISLNRFIDHLEEKQLWFLNNMSVLEENSKYVLLNIVHKEQDEIVFTDKMLVSGDKDAFIAEIIHDDSKESLTQWLRNITDRTAYTVHIYLVPKKEKKTIAVLNKYFCSVEKRLLQESNTNQFQSLFDVLEERVNINNTSTTFFLIFSMVLLSILVTLLLRGYPLSAITFESLILVAQETLLVLGGMIGFILVTVSIILWIFNIFLTFIYSNALRCKVALVQSVKTSVIIITCSTLVFLFGATFITAINYFRVSQKLPMFENPIIDLITDNYVRESFSPSIQEVIINDENQSEMILMMGIKDNIVYYYPQFVIQNLISKDATLKDKVCTEAYYPANTIQLLKSGQLRYKKSQIAALKNVKFIPNYHAFTPSFCDLNTSEAK